jgi:RNA polymerase sigma-70 factor (ECF subfamily)
VETNRELEAFLRGVSTRAFRIARLSLHDDADALDAVQEAMIKLARHYGDRPAGQWPPLFYAILRNCVHDEQRARRSRSSWLSWFSGLAGASEVNDPDVAEPAAQPAQEAESEQRLRLLETAIATLPPRQREAFLLRNVEELDVSETATAMGCSESSVKTHYSRAIHALRVRLGRL